MTIYEAAKFCQLLLKGNVCDECNCCSRKRMRRKETESLGLFSPQPFLMEALFANRRSDLYYYTEEWAQLLDETFTSKLLTQR